MSGTFNPWALGLPVALGLTMLTVAVFISLWTGPRLWLLILPVGGVLIGHWLGEAFARD